MGKRLTKDEFVKKANVIHNNKYDYSLVDYKNSHTKVKIICLEHGIFEQRTFCEINNIKLIRIKYNRKLKSNDILETINNLL